MNKIQLNVHSHYERKVYYVYVYLDPQNDEPIWVGKGMGDRYASHIGAKALGNKEPFHQRLAGIIKDGGIPEVRLVLENLEEKEALYWEAFFIEAIGRRNDPINHGPLLNLRAGGPGSESKKYKGVAKKGSKFKGNICDNGSKHLGYFDTAELAARAVDQAFVARDGEDTVFHKLNFPEDWDGTKCLRDWVERRPDYSNPEKVSKYRGVQWEARHRKGKGKGWRRAGWRCQIDTRLGKKHKHCRDELSAAKLYDELAKEFQGVRAIVNFPEDWDGVRCLRLPIDFRPLPRGLKPHEESPEGVQWNTPAPAPAPAPRSPKVPNLGGGPRKSGRGYVRGPNPGKRFKGIWQETIVINGTKYPLPEAWHSRIQVDGKYLSLGKHTSDEKAARAFDAAALVYQAEPWLNFPEEHGRVNPQTTSAMTV
jgi:hypothetical protein